MEIPIQKDGDRQPYVEWNQGCGGYNRAWIRRPTDPDKDWAGVGRYLNVLRVEEPYRGPADNSTDFPIPSDLDEPQGCAPETRSFLMDSWSAQGHRHCPADMSAR